MAKAVLALSMLALLASAGTARAADWVPSVKVADLTSTASATPRTVMDDAGDVFVAWFDQGSPQRVHVSKRPAGGSFEPDQTIDPTEPNGADEFDLAVDGSGNAVIVWTVDT